MKRILSFLMALSLVLSLAAIAGAESVEYIAAPYNASEVDTSVTYLDPVYYENDNGPTIGVTTLGVIVKDGKYYKDLNNNQALDDFENWELPAEERAASLVANMTLADQAGFVMNALLLNAVTPKLADVKNEDGTIDPAKVMKFVPNDTTEGSVLVSMNPEAGYFAAFDSQVMLVGRIRCGIYRGNLGTDASVVALHNNIADAVSEQDAALNGIPMIPVTMGSNPIAMGFPDELGRAAAVIGDSDLDAGVINADMIREFAEIDREMWRSQGISFMYGPQIDLVTDPRWPRNSDTYGERENVVGAIIAALVEGYQNGTTGANEKSVVLTAKHFPGDGAAENGFESHVAQGQWRLYPTEGSLQNYQLVAFQAAVDAGVAGIMPCYSRDTTDARSATQTYTNPTTGASMEVVPEALGSAYNKTILTDLLRNTMGFVGYINSDSGITMVQTYGVEDLTPVERFALLIQAGTDAIGGELAPERIVEAVETGLLDKADLDRANINRATNLFKQGLFENPYLDYEYADTVRAESMTLTTEQSLAMHKKAVVLMKNSDNTLPLSKEGTKVYFASFTKEGMADETDDATVAAMTALLAEQGLTLVESAAEADVAYLYINPTPTVKSAMNQTEGVLGLVEDYEVDERSVSGGDNFFALNEVVASQAKSGEKVEVTTLGDMKKLNKIANTVHENGGKVVATCVIKNPWIMTNLEPLCDAILGQYTTSAASLALAQQAQVAVLVGDFNPTGKLCVTMVSDESVIALTENVTLADGTIAEICASPNDVPGYAKDQYIDPAILANVNGGSYAYMDADGNYYVSGFGLSF